MKRRVIVSLLAAVCLLSLSAGSLAFTPTPTPVPELLPEPTPLLTVQQITPQVYVRIGETTEQVPLVMRYANLGWMYADGIVFTDKLEYASRPFFGEIGTLPLTAPLKWYVECHGGEGETHTALYACTDDGFVPVDGLPDPVLLLPGTYLWTMDVTNTIQDGSYTGLCLLYLTVADDAAALLQD